MTTQTPAVTEETLTIATEGTMKGKLVAARGFTTKKKFLGKLSETFSKEALASISLQKTTMAYAFGEMVKGFYFSLNFDVVPKAERVPLFNKLFQSELAEVIQFSLPVDKPTVYEPLKAEDVVKVYEGEAGTCRCGCAGEYYYNPAFDAEINARNADPEQIPRYTEERTKSLADVIRIVELINSHLKDEFKTVTCYGDSYDLEIEGQVWTAYTKEVFAFDDRIKAKGQQKAAESMQSALIRNPEGDLGS